MRIRKRQPVVLHSALAGLADNILQPNPEADLFVGQNTCTCCTREKQLYWELNKQVERDDDEPSRGFDVDESATTYTKASLSESWTTENAREVTLFSRTEKFGWNSRKISSNDGHNSEIETEVIQPKPSATLETFGSFNQRAKENDHHMKSAGERAVSCASGQFPISEGDVNHPGNKPKDSLLYSLYCVFSKLSGKVVLTAREALSRIIEERLPGLDEETGLPTVQVAKVMRSNPYFVHLEGGKFFLCSGPSTDGRDETSRRAMNSENPPRPMIPSMRQKIAPLYGLCKTQSSIEEQQVVMSTEVRNKRPRSKGTVTDDATLDMPDCKSKAAKKGGVGASKPQTSVAHDSKDGPDIGVPICKRYDGRGWKCYERALEGYSMCRHHHELIVNRLARLRNSGRLGSKKPVKRRKSTGKQLKESTSLSEGEINNEQSGAHWWKNVKARSLKSIN